MKPTIWTIAGLDPSGGAGLATDILTSNYFNVHCCTLLTTVLSQNHHRVIDSISLTAKQFQSQVEALLELSPPHAIKIGLIKKCSLINVIAKLLIQLQVSVILDPIFMTSSCYQIYNDLEFEFYKKTLLPLATILTPNVIEAEKLLDLKINNQQEIEEAAPLLLKMGPKQVIIKGGHLKSSAATDYWTNGKQTKWISSPRIQRQSIRGTGCAFATAIAANIAKGEDVLSALNKTKTFMQNIIINSHAVDSRTAILEFKHDAQFSKM